MKLTNDLAFANALCREHFSAFAQRAFNVIEPATKWDHNWHVDVVAEHLESSYRGELPRLIINIPPRSLKSYLVSTAFPAWVLGHAPHSKFICTSYGFEVVEANARRCKQIIMSEWYKQLFPRVKISPLLDRITNFETTEGGQYYAASALSPLTGIGADYILADDLIKPMEALSDTVRNSTNNNIRSTLLNRFNDRRTGRFIMVMQRLHDDDPTGHLIRDGGYHNIVLPAETKQEITITLKDKTWIMPANSLLFPERLSREVLDRIRLDMSEYNYAGQYLQSPVPMGGGEFKDNWMQYYAQGSIKPKQMNVYMIIDQAGGEELNRKKKKLSDWTVINVIGLADDNNIYILDIVRDRFNPTERIETIFMMHRKWNAICGKPPKVGCEQIGLMTDVHYIRERQKQDAYHFPIIPLGSGQRISKEERIRVMIPDMQKSRWYMPGSLTYMDCEGRKWDLTRELVDVEMGTFPKSRYDDILDTCSRLYDPELNMIFPKPKVGTVAKARLSAMDNGTDDWQSW